MSYSRTENWINGDTTTPVYYYNCDITGEEFCESQGWYGNSEIHISEKGLEILIEEWIKRNSIYSSASFFIYSLEQNLKRGKPYRYISKKDRKIVLDKYEHKCCLCGSTKNLEVDHIKPVSKGGLSDLKNLQVLCKECNIKKSNKYEG